ncbi:helix-turn-helix domain-containing protein [Rhodanobacter sp. BL-MT-08]
MSEIFAFDSADYDPATGFARYCDLYAYGSDTERVSGPFFARVQSWRLDRTLLFMREYGGVRHRRGERVKRDGFDHFVLHHVLSGELTGGADGSPKSIAAGETLVLDTSKPMESGARSVKLITVSLTRDAMHAAAGSLSGLHGYRIGVTEGALLSPMLQALVREASRLPLGAYAAITRIIVDLLAVALNPGGTAARSDFHRLEYVRREASVRVIEANLCRSDFSVQDIVSATGIARASLYRLFEPQGGVARFIQLRRLQHLRDRLDDRAFDSQPLAELAPLSGFSGESHASRLFKQAFGMAPGAYRAASIRGAQNPSVDLMTRRWFNSMSELK